MTSAQRSASVTSRITVSTCTPASAAALATTSAFSSERTDPTGCKPRRAASRTVASPIPEFAPVTSTFLVAMPTTLPALRDLSAEEGGGDIVQQFGVHQLEVGHRIAQRHPDDPVGP